MIESHKIKILRIEPITHNVRRIQVERPPGYDFIPGQATEVSLPENPEERRPFTFTGLREWEFLEFSIKIYSDHNGVTASIGKLKAGDFIIIHDVWGAIQYKGKGIFIAGGAGVTPFIAIIRDLYKQNRLEGNKLFFSNKTKADIILKDEFEMMLDGNFVNTLTKEKIPGYNYGKFSSGFFNKYISDFHQNFYVCGPEQFVQDIRKILEELGAQSESVVFEK